MANQFSKVRSWVFIDGIDEVTVLHESTTLEAVPVNAKPTLCGSTATPTTGAFEVFRQRRPPEITPKTRSSCSVARSSYPPTQTEFSTRSASRPACTG
jgi:hypothetical protein